VIPRQPGTADETGADQVKAVARMMAARRSAAAPGTAEQPSAEPAAAEQRTTGDPSDSGVHQTTAESVEIHRAAITEREPTLPRSRRGWRSRT
jgi:hypothetical protein